MRVMFLSAIAMAGVGSNAVLVAQNEHVAR